MAQSVHWKHSTKVHPVTVTTINFGLKMTTTHILAVFFIFATFSTPLVRGQVECPPDGIVYIPDPDCTKYWICADGESVSLTCPTGFYFNPLLNECDFPDNVQECQGGTRPPATTPPPDTTTTRRTTTTGPPDGTLRACGERMVANSGWIEYSLDEMYPPRLRCAFVLRTFNHSGFIFTLEENGLIEDPTHSGGSIQIFGFSSEGLADSANLGPPNPLPQAYVAGALAVVILRTQFQGGRGFRLKFEATGAWRYDFVNWDDVVDGLTPGSLSYPFDEPEYHYNTLSGFVFSSNHEQVAIGSNLLLNLHDVDIEMCLDGCTCDFLAVFSFTGSGLQSFDKVCGNDTTPLRYTTDSLFIVIFKSDHTRNGKGFKLEFDLVPLLA